MKTIPKMTCYYLSLSECIHEPCLFEREVCVCVCEILSTCYKTLAKMSKLLEYVDPLEIFPNARILKELLTKVKLLTFSALHY